MPTWINVGEIWNFEEKELFLSCSTRKTYYNRKTGKTTFCPKIDRIYTGWSFHIRKNKFFLSFFGVGDSNPSTFAEVEQLEEKDEILVGFLVKKMEEDEENEKISKSAEISAENMVDQFLGQPSSYYLYK